MVSKKTVKKTAEEIHCYMYFGIVALWHFIIIIIITILLAYSILTKVLRRSSLKTLSPNLLNMKDGQTYDIGDIWDIGRLRVTSRWTVCAYQALKRYCRTIGEVVPCIGQFLIASRISYPIRLRAAYAA